ncbi:MAG: peptidylprolyl isomerase [Oscillospiraceae bacterium]|nr:peptidylprolyl isomerase [Oscillospiraceae bacterium]
MKKLLAVLLITLLLVGCSNPPDLSMDATELSSEGTSSADLPALEISGSAGYGENDETALNHYTIMEASPLSGDMIEIIAVDSEGNPVYENRHLQVAYWTEYLNFMNSYGSYASMLGMDSTKPLYSQSMDDGRTWEQYFLSFAVEGLERNYALAMYAQANGMELSEEDVAAIEDILNSEGNFAEEYLSAGYADADSYLQYYFGDGADAVSYQEYYDMYLRAARCYQAVQEEISGDLTEDEIMAYYNENKETFEAQGKIQKNNINIRHILIQPEGEEADWTEESWAAAEATAQEIYDQWLADPTEEYFSALAIEHTTDPGSQESGGLYENVAPGDMVTEFNDWCFEDGRQVGDHGIVKTTYGYHIMFFSGVTETRAWYDTAAEQLVYERLESFMAECVEKFPLLVDYTRIRIFDVVTANQAEAVG